MRKKDLESIHRLVSRRRAMQGMGAVLAGVAGCGADDASATGDEGSSSGSGTTINPSSASTSTDPSSGSGSADGSSGVDPDSSSGDPSDDSSTGEPVDACNGDAGLTAAELLAEIETVVVLVMENRSFDHYFGSATFLEGWTVDGLDGSESNLDLGGNAIAVFAMDNLEVADPPHGWDAVHLTWNLGKMDGFVIQHELIEPAFHTEVMGYHTREHLPISYALAEGYTLCDHWFAAVLGPTWPNRFYLHCASANGQQGNLPNFGITSIWDVLAQQQPPISARNYYSDVPWAWGGFADPLASFTDGLDEFFQAAQAGTLPQFVMIDPNFGLLGGEGQNDDHPAANVTMGQVLLAAVHEALAQSPQWGRCLFIITYDEHGGFYDHVPPPETVDENPAFTRLGMRVPSLVIGPHVRRGCVNNTVLEHVSVISTLTTRFSLPPINARVTATNDLSSCIDPAYLDDPQPAISLPKIQARLSELLTVRGNNDAHPEMRAMLARGEIPVPAHRRHPEASRDIAMELIGHAQRLGVLTLID